MQHFIRQARRNLEFVFHFAGKEGSWGGSGTLLTFIYRLPLGVVHLRCLQPLKSTKRPTVA